MASIETRVNSRGIVTSHRVIWRDSGKRHAKSFKSQHAAEQWKAMLDIVDGDTRRASQAIIRARSKTPTFERAARAHIAQLVKIGPAQVKRYEAYLTNHTQMLNSMPIDQIERADMARWLRSRVEAGLSAKTIKNVHGFVSGVFSSAIIDHHIGRSPVDAKMLPESTATKDAATFLTMPEFNMLMRHVPEHYHLLFQFLISTGLRLSEAAALTPEDFLLDGTPPSVRVTKAWKDTRTDGWVIGQPKTKKARRTVALPPTLVEALRPHLRVVAPGALVFTMLRGGEVRSGRLYTRVWTKAVKAAQADGLTKTPRIHDLRHSHASLMIGAGMSIYELSYRLGHEATETTSGTYSHLVPDAHFRAVDYAERALTT